MEKFVEAVESAADERGVELDDDEISELLLAVGERLGDLLEEQGVVEVPGIGTFELRRRGGRDGLDPKNEGQTISIASTDWIDFEPGATLDPSGGEDE